MIRTREQLQELFRESRERKQKERQQKRLEKQKQYQQLCKQADQLLKQAEQDAKNKLMVQLQALAPKKPQVGLKQHSQPHYNIYNTNLIEREPSDRDLYTTRDALQRWEEANWKCINWEVFDRVVNETRQMLGL